MLCFLHLAMNDFTVPQERMKEISIRSKGRISSRTTPHRAFAMLLSHG
jgi:hypothetical protein